MWESIADEQAGERLTAAAARLAMRPVPGACPGATRGGSLSITSAMTASAGAASSLSIGASPTRRPLLHTATTTALSKVHPRIPSNTAPTRFSGLATGTLRTA